MEVKWLGWFPWEVVRARDPGLVATLDQTGAYLIACASARPEGTPTATLAEVVYIGETHRRGRSLRQRLIEFGNSAGFNGKQRNGHSGGWRWPPDLAGEVGADHCWIAVAPTPAADRLPSLSLREIFPTCVESRALWEHVEVRQRLPALNARERTGAGSDLPRPEVDVQALLRKELGAATALAEWVASRWDERPPRKVHAKEARYKSGAWIWRGVEQALGEGWWIGVGWSEAPAEVVDVWVWKDGARDKFWKTAASEVTVRGLIDSLMDLWNG